MFLFYLMPTFVIVVSSVQNIFTGFGGELTITFAQYEKIFFGDWSADFWAALGNTLFIAVLGALVGMFLASVASYIIIKSDSLLAGFIDFLTISPISIPGIVLAMSFMWIFLTYNFLGLYQTVWIIILAFTSRFIVIGSRASNAAFRSISQELEEAAQINGANLFTILRKIYWPLIRPGFISGFALLTIIYMKVLSIPILLQGGRQNLVLAVMLWQTRNGGEPEIASAVAVVMMVLVGGGYVIMSHFINVNLSRF
jgi:iron(III) transport system permease protein